MHLLIFVGQLKGCLYSFTNNLRLLQFSVVFSTYLLDSTIVEKGILADNCLEGSARVLAATFSTKLTHKNLLYATCTLICMQRRQTALTPHSWKSAVENRCSLKDAGMSEQIADTWADFLCMWQLAESNDKQENSLTIWTSGSCCLERKDNLLCTNAFANNNTIMSAWPVLVKHPRHLYLNCNIFWVVKASGKFQIKWY